MTRGHLLSELVEAGLAPSERYLMNRLRDGRIKGMKVGHQWRMTDAHIADYIAAVENHTVPRIAAEPTTGLSSASRRLRRVS